VTGNSAEMILYSRCTRVFFIYLFFLGGSVVNGNGVGITHVFRVIGIRYYKITV
jgi:hypothetical protein